MTITDFADPRASAKMHVAEVPALILAKGSKIRERLGVDGLGPARPAEP